MALWVDKYHPRKLENLDLHANLTARLKVIARSHEFPHLLFSGPAGAGKRTRVSALLAEVFCHDSVAPERLKLEHKSVKVSESKTVDVTTLCSPYHMEINLTELGNNDRAVVMTIIKEIAQSAPIPTSAANARPFKVLVLHEVDRMSRPAQQALRRTMEKFVATCRLVLVAESTGRLIAPIRSRCLELRVPAPTDNEVLFAMQSALANEGEAVASLPESLTQGILQASQGNLRRALLLLEAAWKNGKVLRLPEWQDAINDIATSICREQTPKKLHEIRGKYYDLLASCVPAEIILRGIVLILVNQVDALAQQQITYWGAFYDHSMRQGSKPIFHLEAFAARAMTVFKAFTQRVGM
jgi:replication factor C subunit 3/5